MKHSFKNPRYSICFQTKNKVWIYKNSRLRNFYKIRSKMILKTGKRARKFLVTKNMKWTVARRQMVPYFRKVRKYTYSYRKLFFTKQQLKNFYGRLKEYQIRNMFKQTWNKTQFFRTNIFIGALEQRLNVILYRMRLLPTIFACNQLIQHKGIFVNKQLINFLYFRVNLGDIISIPQEYWFIFYQYLYERLRIRFLGEGYAVYRRNIIIKKLQYYFVRYREIFYKNFYLINYCGLQFKKGIFFKKLIKLLFNQLKKNLKLKKKINKKKYLIKIFWLKIFNWFLEIFILKKLKKIRLLLKTLRLWGRRNNYYQNIRVIWFSLNYINYNFKKFNIFFQEFLMLKLINKTLFNKDITNSYEHKINFLNKISIYSHKALWRNQRIFFPHLKSKYLLWLLRQLKYKKHRKNFFKQLSKNLQWYTPKYLEIDYNTLRASYIYYPQVHEIVFGFACSFKRIVSFYKERAL